MKRYLLLIATVILTLNPTSTQASHNPNTCGGQETNDHRDTEEADFLSGSAGRDVISLGEGGDQYFAFDGEDVLCGDDGGDVLAGEAEDDVLNGGQGDDTLVGFGGGDVISAGFGTDEVDGRGGADRLTAAAADLQRDNIYDGPGSDEIVGNDEDFWFRCADDTPDDHTGFSGTIVADPNC